MMETLVGKRCHFSFSKYPRVLRSSSSARIIACTGKLVEQCDEWATIDVDSIHVHPDDSHGQNSSYETRLVVKTDAIISIQRYG